MREIVFDTETTGFDPAGGDRIVEIGCIELFERRPTGRSFHAYFNPERPMPRGAEAVHGLSDTFLSDKPLFQHRVDELLEFLGDAPMIAHNAEFDFGFVDMELNRCGRSLLDRGRMICTVAMARARHPMAKNSLDALCTRYGIDRSHRVKHGALLDAELLVEVYIELNGGRQIGLMLDAEAPVAQSFAAASAAPRPIRDRTPCLSQPSEAELARHAAFIAKIDDAVWNDGAGRF